MRFVHFISFMITVIGLTACKSNVSELKATPAQRSKFKVCIVSTIMESFAASKPDINAVNAFADDMVKHAPSDNDKPSDAAFEEYTAGLGCDPNKLESKNEVGTMIVAAWSISPFNPSTPKEPIAPKKP